MRVTYDPDADAAYLYLTDSLAAGAAARQLAVPDENPRFVLDFDSGDTLLGIEVLGARQALPAAVLEPRTAYVAVLIYSSSSDAPGYLPLYEEVILLLHAASADAARVAALRQAADHESRYRNDSGETITWTLEQLVDIAPAVDDMREAGIVYSRHFRDYEAYCRMEPLLSGEPL